MHKLPLLDILDDIKDPSDESRTLLDYVICNLYIDKDLSAMNISAMMSISLTTIYKRIPKDDRKACRRKENLKTLKKVIAEQERMGKCVKEIAYDLGVPPYKIYKLRKEGFHNDVEEAL